MPRIVIAGCVLALSILGGCYSPTLPLPPPGRDGLTVTEPDDQGFVEVTGEPGVMEPGQQAVIINQSTRYGWIVPIGDDGWLRALVQAESGDVLTLQRRSGFDQSPAIDIVVP